MSSNRVSCHTPSRLQCMLTVSDYIQHLLQGTFYIIEGHLEQKMTIFILYVMTITLSVGNSEWVELPQITPLRNIVIDPTKEIKIPSPEKPASHLAELTADEIIATKKNNETEPIEIAEMKLETVQNLTTFGYDLDMLATPENDKGTFNLDQNKIIGDSFNFERNINEITRDFGAEPQGGIAGKLKYLKKLENKLLSQTRMYTESVWVDRQARGKKLLGFPSMEGALMTIAFLTFAVFLIKIVMQFIQGLQNAEQTLLMTLASTPAPVRISNRPKRVARDLAAAQILRFIDDYSIKHKLHCDFEMGLSLKISS